MSTSEKLVFVTFDFENVSSSLVDTQPSGFETKEHVAQATELANLAKYREQPWVNENDDSKNFESAELPLQKLVKLNEQFEQKFEPTLAAFFDYMISGRSFSGRRIADGADFYAFLSKVEIEEVIALLQVHYEASSELLDKGAFCKVDFESEMVEVMECLLVALKQARDYDLFITKTSR